MTTANIFLSYNREDAVAAKRFADVCSPNFTPKNGRSAFHPIPATAEFIFLHNAASPTVDG